LAKNFSKFKFTEDAKGNLELIRAFNSQKPVNC
jgi:hypothetical protein